MDHKDLEAWKQAMLLAEEVYRLTEALPPAERYGLVGQMRRAAVSVPSNLSEGAARASRREFSHFLSVCLGSLAELETQLLLCPRLGYPVDAGALERLRRVRALVAGLKKSQSRIREEVR